MLLGSAVEKGVLIDRMSSSKRELPCALGGLGRDDTSGSHTVLNIEGERGSDIIAGRRGYSVCR